LLRSFFCCRPGEKKMPQIKSRVNDIWFTHKNKLLYRRASAFGWFWSTELN
jgi:hypothetical protein